MFHKDTKLIKMSFPDLIGESRRIKSWIPCPPIKDFEGRQARNDGREHLHSNKKGFTPHYRRGAGFTLIELIITMLLIGIIAYIVATAMSTGFKAYFTTDSRKEALDQARIAMERMTREIRNVSTKGKDNDSDGYMDADITTATGTNFCFKDTTGTTIGLRYFNNSILRGEGSCPPASENTLATNVTSLNLQYIVATTTAPSQNPSDPTDIRRVQIGWSPVAGISVTINNETVSLSSEVYLRNMQ